MSTTPLRGLFALEPDNAFRAQIGIQLYTLRNQISRDVVATMKAVVDAGYFQAELYGFPDADAMIHAAKDVGLRLNSAHFNWGCVTSPKDKDMSEFLRVLEKARAVGLSHLVIPYLHGHERKTLDDYRKVADNANKAAIKAKEAGIQLAYHNHAFEFQPMEGGISGFDIFSSEFVPEMQFELDVFWVKVGGIDPVELIKRLSGRVSQVHLKDLKAGVPIPSFGGVPNDAFQELGNGIIPMEPVMVAAKAAGVAICHVEQDQSPDPIASIRASMAHLRSL